MKIRSLLLGSAAAMVAVTGAQAADAIVVEPEPVEYVRICDAYGSGYFFIPGTEVCLKFGGYVRTYYAHRDFDAAGSADRKSWFHRARFQVDTANETDWGTLSARFRIQSNGNAQSGNTTDGGIAFISIAGLRAGSNDSYWATNHGYSGVAGIEGVEGEDGPYGFAGGEFVDYTITPLDGLSVTVGVEDITGGGSNADSTDGQANFYAGFNYSAGIFGLAFTAAHDNNTVFARKGWAYKASLDIDISEFIPGGNIHAKYLWEDLDAAVPAAGAHTGYTAGADETFQIGFHFNAADNLVIGATYYNQQDTLAIGTDRDFFTIGFDWQPVSKLKVFGSYNVSDTNVGSTSQDFDQFVIGLRRNF